MSRTVNSVVEGSGTQGQFISSIAINMLSSRTTWATIRAIFAARILKPSLIAIG